jgi:hypothetical protein
MRAEQGPHERFLVGPAQLQDMARFQSTDRCLMDTADDEIGKSDALKSRCFPEELLLFGGHSGFKPLVRGDAGC